MSDQIFWFATRAAGIMTWFSATLSLCVGLMMSSRALGRRPTIPWLLDVHRFTAAMSMVFLFLHLFTLWVDSFVDLSLADFVVPGRADVPGLTNLSVAWGVIAAWILVVVQASSLIKKYIAPDWWHTIHLTSFGIVIAGLAHAVQAGSDADNRILIAIGTSLLTAIVLLLATRILRVLLDRKYQFDRANDADGTADNAHDSHGSASHGSDSYDSDSYDSDSYDDYEQDERRRRWRPTRQPEVVAHAAANSAPDGAVALSDVDLDAYAYGDFSHLPSEHDEELDVDARADADVDDVATGNDPEVEPVTDRPVGGPPAMPAVKSSKEKWGGPGSFAAPRPEIEGGPTRPAPRPRPRPEEGGGPPPIRR